MQTNLQTQALFNIRIHYTDDIRQQITQTQRDD